MTRNVPPGLDEYNPFSDSRTVSILIFLSMLLNFLGKICGVLFSEFGTVM